ncbi:MBL fold metallo-hydrolase [Actinoallomurus sp. CA-150999]|uniref:MBL fold metallo-hydrolase n=1 Tax=Actinoallomurus sp. CA-150999 TaxID=3239887 RepID=UPI003D8A1805
MPHPPKVFAGVEVTPLCDAVGPMGPTLRRPLDETFPGATAEHWAAVDAADWVLHFHCYLLRDPANRTILVDTGIGGTDGPASTWAPVPGRLMAEVAAAGLRPEDVDVVVLTHLHSDHAGGAVVDGVPAFPDARYLLQRDELDWVRGPVLDQVVRPLGDSLQVVDGLVEMASGITLVPTPGHTPGHQSVEVGPLVLGGDVVLHPVQLVDPSIRYAHDEDADLAAATRAALLTRIRERSGTLGTAHFAEPFTELRDPAPGSARP